MSVSPTIAVVGSFVLLVVAAVVFVAALMRGRRQPEGDNGARHHSPSAGRASAGTKLDTSLEGLDLSPSEDAPSAVLLTPLRTSEWMPPDTPAPAGELPAVSLAERIAGFEPEPDIPEPSFAVVQHPEWHVAPEVAEAIEAGPPPPEPAVSEVPMPAPTPPHIAEPILSDQPDQAEDDFDAEIAALLPKDDLAAVFGAASDPLAGAAESAQVPELESPAPSAAAPVPEPPAPPTPVPTPEPEPVPAPEPAPLTMPEPEPEPMPEPVPEPVPVPVSETAIAPAEESAPEPEPAPEAVPVAAVQPEPAPAVSLSALAEDAFWAGLLAEHQSATPAEAPAGVPDGSATRARPVVRVTTAEPPEPQRGPEAPERHAGPRPRATIRIHPIPEDGTREGETRHVMAPLEVDRDDAAVPEMVLEAPVEMWFGNSRIGVKPGSATYDKFRRYADALLADLNESVSRADKV